MNFGIQSLSALASNVAKKSRRGVSALQHETDKVGAAAIATGKMVRATVDDAIASVDTEAAAVSVRAFAAAATEEAGRLANRAADKVKLADRNHKKIADNIESVSMGLGIATGVTAAGASLAAPAGLSAIGVALGITSAPLIVAAAPLVAVSATAVGVVSGAAYFFSKWRSAKDVDKAANDHQ